MMRPNEITQKQGRVMHVRNPVESILTLAASVFNAYSVVLFDMPGEGQKAQILAAYSQGSHIDQNASITPGRGLVGWILRNNSPIVIGTIDETHAYLGYYEESWEPDVCSFLGCPLPEGGILCIDSRERHAFTPEKQRLIAVFSDMLAQVRNFEQQEGGRPAPQNDAYLAALGAMAELRQNYGGWKSYIRQMLPIVLEASGFSYAAFASRPEGGSNYIVEGETPALLLKDGEPAELSLHSGLIGWVFRNEEALFSDGSSGPMPLYGKRDGVPDFEAVLCIPVRLEKSICGVLCLAANGKQRINEELRTFAQLAADDLGRLLEVLSLRYRLRMAEKARQEA